MNQIIKSYINIVYFLGSALGSDYEIALHDLTNEGDYSIVAIANGFNSNRKIGSPLTKKALSFIENKTYVANDYVLNYTGTAANKSRTVSSTMFIKDENKNLIGMLCVNYNTGHCKETVDKILNLVNLTSIDMLTSKETITQTDADSPEIFSNNVYDLVYATLEQTLPQGTSVSRLTQNEKMDIVKTLKEHGIFNIKGAVREVANQLSCSEPSIYRYLKNI